MTKSPTTDSVLQNTTPVLLPENLPADVREWLSRTSAALVQSFAEDLRALILFGSAAEGRMRASSDVNLLVVLDRLDVERLNGVAELIQMAAAAVELHPMFVLFSDLPLAAEAFAVKFDDIAHRHALLYGVDPFSDLVIPRGVLIGRIQQVLLNLTLRARTSYAVNLHREQALPSRMPRRRYDAARMPSWNFAGDRARPQRNRSRSWRRNSAVGRRTCKSHAGTPGVAAARGNGRGAAITPRGAGRGDASCGHRPAPMKLFPFNLTGPHFLWFFILFGLCVVMLPLYRRRTFPHDDSLLPHLTARTRAATPRAIGGRMSAALEIFLARLYSNAVEAESFLRERAAYARAAGLPEEHLQDVLAIDAGSLRFTAQSFEDKRRGSASPR